MALTCLGGTDYRAYRYDDRDHALQKTARFMADRDDQDREYIGKSDAFEAEITKEITVGKFTYAELEEEDIGLKKLQS